MYIKRKGNEKYPNYIQESEPQFYHSAREADSAYEELCRQVHFLSQFFFHEGVK